MNQKPANPENAAAELYARSLKQMNVIDTAWRKPDTSVVCATTSGDGVHLGNQAQDFDADVHLVCATESFRGDLPDGAPPDGHGDVFFNVKVNGVVDDPTGYALPTHIAGPAEAKQRDDLAPDLAATARMAGVDLDV